MVGQDSWLHDMAYIETRCVPNNNSRLKHSEANPRNAISLITLKMMHDARMGHLVHAGDRTWSGRGALWPLYVRVKLQSLTACTSTRSTLIRVQCRHGSC